ncbi:anthranilate synthase component I family protein [Glaciihabitans arcticus]|uniref:Anthranilate synthase component I family protein n=1 Tax=Glaciihabitans arcticus TaxID=2668039 RepID=A0A4V2JEV0_9MICO|nr:anthranilate synthase component I family protein [Glaciihabitans arcticus]TBN56989.1 anthranilate synthase component I family protein [Glaciihabitans arcticus]
MQPGVLTCAVADWVDPAAAFATLFGESRAAFWLDSADTGRSFMGTGAPRIAGGSAEGDGAALLGDITADLAARRTQQASGPLGWVGWLGYELRAATMGVSTPRVSRYPDAAFLAVDRAVAFDHETRVVSILALGDDWSGELGAWRDAAIAALQGATVAGAGHPEPADAAEVAWAYADDEYLDLIRACQASIVAGDAYQLCLTTEASVDVTPDPLTAYLALRASSPSHHGAFLRLGDVSLLSATPEQFLTVTPLGVVESKPIKGTRPRGASPAQDAALKAELLASDKERAENLMIVDLMRNDIARVAEVGSVSVPSLLAVESYAHVHQLVSTVRGQLREELSGMDAVLACFPAGSMTGAPKRSATLLLDALEGRPRGIYSGAFGRFGLDGSIDLAMVIRSIVLDPEGATVGTGGGITALSVPEEELAEAKLKAAALLRVLGIEQVG